MHAVRYPCSTPFGITEVLTAPCASTTNGRSCAQRLSASQRFSRRATRTSFTGCTCAQRLSASQRFSRDDPLIKIGGDLCSTPFGITEVLTSRRRTSQRSNALVLNAFRHHRGSHPSITGRLVRIARCSTPFGITEVLTTPDSGVDGRGVGAQRLSASQRFSPAPEFCVQRRPLVLNAFRHHRGSHFKAKALPRT